MKKAVNVGPLVTAGIGAAAMWLANKPNRIKAKSVLREWKRKITTPYSESTEHVIEKGGSPNPHDIEDNEKLVAKREWKELR